MTSLEERCVSLKSTIEQLNTTLEKASVTESELKNEISLLQHNLIEITTSSQSHNEKLKQVLLMESFLFKIYKLKYLILVTETTIKY